MTISVQSLKRVWIGGGGGGGVCVCVWGGGGEWILVFTVH